MKIWIDTRCMLQSLDKERFVYEILLELNTSKYEKIYFTVYKDKNTSLDIDFWDNFTIKDIDFSFGSFGEQFGFKKLLNDDNNDLIIFLEHERPVFYKKKNIVLLHSLEDISYLSAKTEAPLNKAIFSYLLKKTLVNTKKVVCFSKYLQNEINERLNIEENKIEVVNPFFYNHNLDNANRWDVDPAVKMFQQDNNEYLIYPGWDGYNKNLKRLLEVIKELDVWLAVVGTSIMDNLEFRRKILELEIQKKVHFFGLPNKENIKDIYDNSLGVIFPSMYESFPFSLSDAVELGTPIIASGIPIIRDIFGDKIDYFNQLSTSDMIKTTTKFIKKKKTGVNYKKIRESYNSKSFIDNLMILDKM